MKRQVPHQIINGIECKFCSKCQELKPVKWFSASSTAWDKLYPSCKECKKKTRKYTLKLQPNKNINGIIFRLCSKCNNWNELSSYIKNERVCKDCRSFYNSNYYEINREFFFERNIQYRKDHKDEITITQKLWRDNNKEHIAELNKDYRIRNKDKLREYDRKKHHKYKTNINYRITKNMRRRILSALKGNPKISTTLNLIGCDIETFKSYLANLFQPGMSWENYGEWHIDHIIPCASFDLSKKDEQKKCFSLYQYATTLEK